MVVGCHPVVDGHQVVGGGGDGGVSTLQSQQPMLQLQPGGAGEEGGAAVTEVRAVWGTRDDPCPSREKQVQMCTIDAIYCFIASRKCWVSPSINTVAS